MRTELINLLTAYLYGWKSIRDCAEWLAGVDWDDSSMDLRATDLFGSVELLVTEVLEGMRPEAEFWQEALTIVERESNVWSGQPTAQISQTTNIAETNDTINIPLESIAKA